MSTKTKKKPARRLSKSKFVLGLQCEKALYLTVHSPELAGEVSDGQQMIFDNGHLVGTEAQKRFPGGVVVDAAYDETDKALQQTQDAIAQGALAIFEATFQHEGVLVKIDVLHRKSVKAAWQIKEVKSSTSVKDVYLQDAAIQLWVARANLSKVDTVSIMVINNQCVYPKLDELFNTTDVTIEAEAIMKDVPRLVKHFQKVLGEEEAPETEISPHCKDPYPCAFQDHCWVAKKVPKPSAFDLPNIRSVKAWKLYGEGKVDLKKLDPEDFTDLQARMIEATISGKRFIDAKGIAKELKGWKYPLSFLDFETISFPIPRYDGTRPFQHLPFQFSCHIQGKPKGKVEHVEYLHLTNTDPREAVAKALVDLVPKEGSVVAYWKSVEGGVLKNLAELFPKYAKDLLAIRDRLVDPQPIFRSHVLDPEFHGSFSLKDVAPAILGEDASYTDMEVADGSAAQAGYMLLIGLPGSKAAEREKVRQDLIDYCTKDTLGMVRLVEWLYKSASSQK